MKREKTETKTNGLGEEKMGSTWGQLIAFNELFAFNEQKIVLNAFFKVETAVEKTNDSLKVEKRAKQQP